MIAKTVLAAGMLVLLSCSFGQWQPPPRRAQAADHGSCVVELFTSEGCSSCPAADALMPGLKERYGDAVLILSYHVDYWDRLGWKDAFSKPEWTARQQRYAAALSSDNIYTPQAVVNGKNHLVGSNAAALEKLIAAASKAAPAAALTLSARAEGGNVTVAFETSLRPGEQLDIALVQPHAITNVGRGENSGRRLQHYNVVRELKTTSQATGSLSFRLPEGLTKADVGVIAFVQRTDNMHILCGRETSVD